MNSFLKKWKNHSRSVTYFALAIAIVFLGYALPHVAVFNSNNLALVISNTLIDMTNSDRIAVGEKILAVSPILTRAAQAKANDMANKAYFSHTSPGGVVPWYWFNKVGYTYTYAGENLAVNFSDSAKVNLAWMNSPGHKANILNNNFTEIGIATAQGMYNGKQTTFVVELFGRPSLFDIMLEPIQAIQENPVLAAILLVIVGILAWMSTMFVMNEIRLYKITRAGMRK